MLSGPAAPYSFNNEGFMASKGGAIPALDSGGDVPDPGGVDMGQGQEGQAGDLSGALNAVQQAYQYGLQQITGNTHNSWAARHKYNQAARQ